MSIGQQFLARLNEAKSKKQFTFDRGVEAMKRSMRDIGGPNDLADKIGETMAMFGIPGMYLNKPVVRQAVVDAAIALRTKAPRVRAFLTLHSALSAAVGVVPAVSEAKVNNDELEGSSFQKTVEEILVMLGASSDLVGKDAKPAARAGLKRACAMLRIDENVRAAVVTLARVAGIKPDDGIVEAKAHEKGYLSEASIDYVATAEEMIKALGIDLDDTTVVRVVSQQKLQRAIKAATRDPHVRTALMAFANRLKVAE